MFVEYFLCSMLSQVRFIGWSKDRENILKLHSAYDHKMNLEEKT